MRRKLAIVAALLISLSAGPVLAVGLGEITLNSALNQKLDAEIELLEVGGLDPAEILASLASTDDFTRVGVERFFYLTSLRFAVEMRPGNRAVVKVTSAQPITEPYLNFLVQVFWPNGRLLKEYTLLLDPPAFADQSSAPMIAPPRSDPGGGPAGRVERIPTRPDSQVSLSPSSEPRQAPEDRIQDDSYGMTDRDDTLWAIALKTRPSSRVSVQQHMLAIERANPQAFIGGNINLLKAGYVLKLPSEAEAAELTAAAANNEVAEHQRQWEAYRAGQPLQSVADAGTSSADGDDQPAAETPLAGQVDATAPRAGAGPTAAGPDGELRIVAGEGGAGTGTGGTGEGSENVEGQLVASEEERDRISRENDELVYRLDKTTGELEQTQRQIEVRDQQIAQLQERLAQLEQQAATPGGAAAPATGRTAASWTDWLQSPLVLIALAVLIVGGVVWALIAARTRRSEDRSSEVYAEARAPRVPRPRSLTPVAATVDDEPAEAPLTADDDNASLPLTAQRDAAPAREGGDDEVQAGAQTSDVIGEADIYIAYGRFPQAIGLLLGALDDDPNRSDVRLKLLELYTETRDDEGFAAQMAELVKRCDDETILLEARALESKLRDEDSAGERASAALEVASDDDARGLDEFSLDLEPDEPALDVKPARDGSPLRAPTGGVGDELGGDLGMDFDPDKEPAVMRSARPAVRRTASRGEAEDSVVEFDLEDLEFEKDNAAAPAAGKATADGDDAFDFLDEEDAASTKLDLARAYIEMGDQDGARDILSEVLQEGTREQQQQANELLEKLS